MRKKRRVEVTVETDHVLIIRQRRRVGRTRCPTCAEPVAMVTVQEAAAVAGDTSRTIYKWVEAEAIHYTETPQGLLLICVTSLQKVTGRAK